MLGAFFQGMISNQAIHPVSGSAPLESIHNLFDRPNGRGLNRPKNGRFGHSVFHQGYTNKVTQRYGEVDL